MPKDHQLSRFLSFLKESSNGCPCAQGLERRHMRVHSRTDIGVDHRHRHELRQQ